MALARVNQSCSNNSEHVHSKCQAAKTGPAARSDRTRCGRSRSTLCPGDRPDREAWLRGDDAARHREGSGRQRRPALSLLPEQTGNRPRALRRAVGGLRAQAADMPDGGGATAFSSNKSLGCSAASSGSQGAHPFWLAIEGAFFLEARRSPSPRQRCSRRSWISDAPKKPLAEALRRLILSSVG